MSKRNWPSPGPWHIVEHEGDGSLWIKAENGDWVGYLCQKKIDKKAGHTFPTKSEAIANALRIIGQ